MAESIPLDVVHEDDDLVVINKAAGMVVHPAPGNWSGTLVNALVGRGEELSSEGGDERPGLVHRLDKDTSGLLVVAKDDRTHRLLSAALYGVGPRDPVVLGAVVALLTVVVAIASLVPARRAMRIDPMTSLRSQ